MNFKKFIMILLFICAINGRAESNTIILFCPFASDILVTKQTGSWADYKYTATIPADIPDIGNRLELIGEGNTAKVNVFQAATWTDRTFVCNYNSFSADAVVIFDTILDQYVKRCYFENTHHPSECNSTNPLSCPMKCELGKIEDGL